MSREDFLKGASKAFCLFPKHDWPDISNGPQRDREALRSDWEHLSQDWNSVLYGKRNNEE